MSYHIKARRLTWLAGCLLVTGCEYEAFDYKSAGTSLTVTTMTGAKVVMLNVGDSVQLKAVSLREDGSDATAYSNISWLSRSAAVNVTSTGMLRGVAIGSGFVLVTGRAGALSDSVSVSVAAK